MNESEFLNWIYSRGGLDPAVVPVGPGDDMAVVNFPHGQLLVAVDQVLDGVHFDLATHGPEAAGRKAMARNLSDIAAMAAIPVGAVASVAMPAGLDQADAQAIYHGLRKMGDEFNCPLVGGDVACWGKTTGPLQISVTVFARPADGVTPVLRSGSQAGDAICVTGKLGGAWYSDRHLHFTPRVREAVALARQYEIHAMIDISDGLAKDLRRLCEASRVGAQLQADAIPCHEIAAGRSNVSPLTAALSDGEDYELLLTLPPAQARQLCDDDKIPAAVTHIGTITETPGLVIIDANAASRPLPDSGWEHKT